MLPERTFDTTTRFVLLILFALCGSPGLKGQLHSQWGFSIGSSKSDHIAAPSHHVDQNGHSFLFATITDVADLDPGPNTAMVNPVQAGTGMLCEYDADGKYEDHISFYAGLEVRGLLADQSSEFLVLALYFQDSLGYVKDNVRRSLVTAPGTQLAIVKVSHAFTILDVYTSRISAPYFFTAFQRTPDGHYLASGTYRDTFPQLGSMPNPFVPVASAENGFICKYDPEFNLVWINILHADDWAYIDQFYLHPDGKTYFAAILKGSVMLETGDSLYHFTSRGEQDALYGFLDDEGRFSQVVHLGGEDSDEIRGIAADDEGNMYISGFFGGTINIAQPGHDPVNVSSLNAGDGLLAKYSPEGELIWSRIFPTEFYGGLYSLLFTRGTDLYATGAFTGRSDLDPGPDSIVVEAQGNGDVFAIKMNTDGEMQWVYPFYGGSFEGIRNLVIGADDRVYLSGYFYNIMDLAIPPDVNEIESRGGSDIYLSALKEEGIISAIPQAPFLVTTLYPNPSSTRLTIISGAPIDYLSIFDTSGNNVLQTSGQGRSEMDLDIGHLMSGMYVVEVVASNKRDVLKFIRP